MNYRHAFHAGNFADVIKHIVLVRTLIHLQEKPAAFRVLDTHAGAGLYDLTSAEAQRGGEWLTGIARLLQARFSNDVLKLVAPYLDIVRAFNRPGKLEAYPGSPLIVRALLRPQDRLVMCELEPTARKRLIGALRHDQQARVVDLDGWTALPAFVPPNERRGLVLIDPSFEVRDEFLRLALGFAAAFKKWPTGIYLLWYPVKERRVTDKLAQSVAQIAIPKVTADKILRVEFSVAPSKPRAFSSEVGTGSREENAIKQKDRASFRFNRNGKGSSGGLVSAGLLVINAPWSLAAELKTILPELQKPLGVGGAARFRIDTFKG